MDSEQIKKGLNNEALFNISGPFHPESEASIEHAPSHQSPDHRKLKGQVVAEPSEKGVLKPTEYSVDPWDHESSPVEQQLFSDISELVTTSISDKIELKKKLSDLYKQAHELMTRYNQRIQSLLMDDRFLYRQSSEISALMIRGLMPPLEEIKTLEKSLTSTRKKLAEEPIDVLQKSASAELEKVEKVLKEAKSRITRHTKPLKPAQLIKKQLEQRLEREASELQQQVPTTAASMPLNNTKNISSETLTTIKAEPVSNSPLASPKNQVQEQSTEDLTSKQLKALAIKLDTSSTESRKRSIQSILSYVGSEYKYYAPLRPFLSVAGQKCELLSMNPDKACKACQEAIALLEDASSLSETELSLSTLVQIDKAINRLASFDKKLPGEVWQLLTELTPYKADRRYHLLNMLCRKLLLDGPTPLTQKAVLNKFQDVKQCLFQFKEETSDEVFDQQFMAVYGQIFTSPIHLKKTLNTVNKPHEVHALLQMLSRQKKSDQTLLSGAIEKLKAIGGEQLDPLLCGAAAFDFLVKELPEKLSSEISNYRPSEPSQTHKQLTQSVLAKYTDYYKAIELAKKQKEDINKPFQHNKTFTQFSKRLPAILIDSEASENTELKDICQQMQAIINQPQSNGQTVQSLAVCRANIIHALKNKCLTDHQASMIIKLFLETQTSIEQSGKGVPTQENSFQAPEEIVQALASLENGASPKWYNQLFTGHLQEQRANALDAVKSIINACQQTTAAPGQVASFMEATALEITTNNDDPLIKQLSSAMKAYAHQLKDS
ncbi:hypothetical protein [Endozoicomonas elysicola]|uniref:Uncharacterized protein n=1 Tax=Endozoicomonas elysicola TaxID=305900 RepID=A0A081KGL1_9GAMM|nr:hypothetical protein [Endozoicomonas elysicola]KEI73287.1 hypothetical protein GV64_23500 [Endozoicomonas elysicola]